MNKKYLSSFLLLFSLLTLFSSYSLAENESFDFKVIALFKNAAMIDHQGDQKLLRVGQSYKKKLKLISADSHTANFLVEGKKISLGLHESNGGGSIYSKNQTSSKSLSIARDKAGMFRTKGFINKIAVNFLVDTGASQVAMNEKTARLLGIEYRRIGGSTSVFTASGPATAWFLTLDSVQVGGIILKQVDALVVSGQGPDEVLLGNSFLRKLKMHHDRNILKLTQ